MSRFQQARQRLEREFVHIENHPDLAPDEKVSRVIGVCATTSAVLAVQPLPMADFALQLPILAFMGFKIGRIRGVDIRRHDAIRLTGEILATVGMGFAARQVLAGLYKAAFPFMGAITTLPLFFALIYAVGKVMDYYFRAQAAGQNVTKEGMREVFVKAHAEGVKKGEEVEEEVKKKGEVEVEVEAPAAGKKAAVVKKKAAAKKKAPVKKKAPAKKKAPPTPKK